jgi:outer membrane protein OmpA-like peptidoglycan-associated protein
MNYNQHSVFNPGVRHGQTGCRCVPRSFSPPSGFLPFSSFGGFADRSLEQEWGTSLVTGMAAACAGYQPGEIVRSNTREGHLPSDVLQDKDGNRLLADFGVNSSKVKDTIKNDPVFKNWVNTTLKMALANPTSKIQIIGYTDCAGPEKNNSPLRRRRAQQILALLDALLGTDSRWKALRSRTVVEAAPVGTYVDNNNTVEGRARNRSVVVKVQTTITFPEDQVTAGPCKTQLMERATKLLQSAKAKQVFPAQKLQRLSNVMANLASGKKDDRFLSQKDVETATARIINVVGWSRVTGYFDELCADINKNGRMSDDDVLHNMWRLDNLILSGICKLKNMEQNPPAHLDSLPGRSWIRALSVNMVGAMMTNPNSVYSSYRSIVLADCPVQGTPIPIPSRRPKPQGGTPPVPRPQGQTLPGSRTGISQWLKDALSGVAQMAGIAISGLIAAIPASVLEEAIEAAWLVFQLEKLPANSLVGTAGERAAQVIAKWALERAGVSGKVFDVNTLRKNFPGIDLLTTSRPYSVKTYGVFAQSLDNVKSSYKQDILKIISPERRHFLYQERVANALLGARAQLTTAGVWPASLSGAVTKEQVFKYIRDTTVFMFPADHFMVMRGHMGAELFGMYKKGLAIPGIPAGLADNDVAPRISKFIVERIQSSGVKSTDLRLMVDVARRLPDARDAVVRRGVKKWPAAWGTPPAWTGSVHRP